MTQPAPGPTTVTVSAVLEQLKVPARAIEVLQTALREAQEENAKLKEENSARGHLIQDLRHEITAMKAELHRSGPVSSVDERWLAERSATLAFRFPPIGSRAGKVEVTLTGTRINPVIADSATDCLDQVREKAIPRRRPTK